MNLQLKPRGKTTVCGLVFDDRTQLLTLHTDLRSDYYRLFSLLRQQLVPKDEEFLSANIIKSPNEL